MALEGEFDMIARIFAPLAKDSGALELKDDAAILTVTDDHQLVVTCDTLVQDIHFLKDDPPRTIGHKALAVNLSDLTAKGARGSVYTLSLALPKETDIDWLEAFAEGLGRVQDQTGISLIGGDTTATSGPPTITVTAIGLVQHENAVTRLGAKPGDRLYVSGTIGDAYLGLRLLQDPALGQAWGLTQDDIDVLIDCYRCPRIDAAAALLVRNFAKAAIDISDGLVADIDKLCHVSHVGAEIETARVPFSSAAKKVLKHSPSHLLDLIAAGDDYVVAMAVSPQSADQFESEAKAHETCFVAIGTVAVAASDVKVLDESGSAISLKHKGFSHF